MELPGQPVTLTVEQVRELNQQLANFRHDINNQLALIMASVEVLKHKPHLSDRMIATIAEQPPKIAEGMKGFAAGFEKALGIKH